MRKEIIPPDGPSPTSTSSVRTLWLSQRRRALRRRNERALLARNKSTGNPQQILSQILLSSANRCLFGYSITANMPFKRACTALALAGSAAAFAPMMSMDMGRREVFHLPAAFLYSPVAYCDRARFSSLLCRSAAVRGSITLPPCFHSIVPWLTATRARTPFSRADCSGWRCGRRGSPAPSSERGAGGAAGLALQLSLRQVARRARDYHL